MAGCIYHLHLVLPRLVEITQFRGRAPVRWDDESLKKEIEKEQLSLHGACTGVFPLILRGLELCSMTCSLVLM